MKDHKAFTLVEVIVILVVLSILAAVAVPVAFRIFQVTAEDTTREEMDNIKKAMTGNPQKLQSSFRSDFGFLGDIGCMPAVLDRLLTDGGLPIPYTFDSAKQAGAGWKGPYITGTPGEVFTTDQWGNNYTYTVPGGPCPLTADLTSNGPNGIPGGDDITISIAANETTATTVRGTVKDTAGVLLEGVSVEFYSAVNGTLTTTPGTTDASGNYSFTSVPFGPRAIKVLPNFVYTPGSVTGGGGAIITFRILNYAEAAVVITQMRVDWTTPPARFNRIRIDLGGGLNTCYNVNADPGAVVTLTCAAGQRTIAASPALRPSTRVFVDTSDVNLPDTTITGGGTAATIEIRFTGNMVVGTPITVRFNPAAPPTSVVKFTP